MNNAIMNTAGYVLISVFGTILLMILVTLLLFSLWLRKKRKELERNGTLIETSMGLVEYWIEGTGPIIALCHGGPGGYDQGYMLDYLISEGYQVLCFSRPGYLRTPIKHNTIKEQTDLLNALIDKLGIQKVVIAGLSAGGPIAIAFAQNYPEKVNGLLLEGAVSREFIPADDVEGSFFAKVLMNPRIQDFMFFIMMKIVYKLIPRVILNMVLKVETTLSKDERKTFLKHIKSHPADLKLYNKLMECTSPLSDRDTGLQNDLTLYRELAPMQTSKIKCPTLIIHSRQDNDVKWEHAEYILESISQAEIFEVFGGHMMWFGPDAEAIRKKRISFLDKLR
ncbi:MAG: alpha/beta hydrolase [Asgard group archaeon]|nr:alpha/beta hydrolase [Asgard group archaeon]